MRWFMEPACRQAGIMEDYRGLWRIMEDYGGLLGVWRLSPVTSHESRKKKEPGRIAHCPGFPISETNDQKSSVCSFLFVWISGQEEFLCANETLCILNAAYVDAALQIVEVDADEAVAIVALLSYYSAVHVENYHLNQFLF